MLEAKETFVPETIEEVEPIRITRTSVSTRNDLSQLVEYPLLAACEHLYDLNIQTTWSSANRDVVSREPLAEIFIDYNNLSLQNKEVAQSLIEEGTAFLVKNDLHIEMKVISLNTPVGEVQRYFDQIVRRFVLQPMMWVQTLSMAEIREAYCYAEDVTDQSIQSDMADDGYFWDENKEVFYKSREQYDKANLSTTVG